MSQKGFEKKLKIGGVLDFTADFGLKVSQVTAGFGYGEGYYSMKVEDIQLLMRGIGFQDIF